MENESGLIWAFSCFVLLTDRWRQSNARLRHGISRPEVVKFDIQPIGYHREAARRSNGIN